MCILFQEERKEKIISILQSQNRIKVLELVEILEVSEATIRRDLQELEESGFLKRTHGGAILNPSSNIEPSFNEKEITFLDEKKYISKLASDFISEGDIIIIDSGTTTIQMIPFICNKKITAITNSIAIAFALGSYENINLIVIGGQHRAVTKAVVGSFSKEMLSKLHANKAFIGTNSLDLNLGATTPNIEEASTKNQMINSSDEVFLLCDNSKFNKISFVKFADIREIDYLITDFKTPESILTKYKNAGIKIIH